MITQKQTMTREQIQETWSRYVEHRDQATRDVLIEYYLPLVRGIAKRLEFKLKGHVEIDDLISCGSLGLMDAVNTFDPVRGVTFETYCTYRVRGAILDAVREMDWVPRLVRTRARQLAEAEQVLANRFGCIPTDCELADQLNVTSQRLASMRSDDRGAKLVSLSDLKSGSSGDSIGDRESDAISDESCEDVAERTLRTEFKEVVLASLSKTEQLVIKMYYYDGNTMAEVGRNLDLSESRVSQIHTSIIARLRARAAREVSEDSKPRLSYGNWRSGNVAFEPSNHSLAA